eukprot:CAMPEP_0201701128 /NCGR_PEP_ID=MMETSP0578-20130828/31357_1 /ASSEMBLY_ACC=CAM_ASM_000663 /TAXON_ID=267565 /ORGANISM="Skeletonema grethea, Strain CCMP 1804" /LENGTH=538 /DNA_ID=CAMNT_0048188357 /DNA_START=130 /DNA_END=1746 /DNA_ORIENTATION=+
MTHQIVKSVLLCIGFIVLLKLNKVNAYSLGDVDPRALRGVWRLTSLDPSGLPFERKHQPKHQSPRALWELRGFLPMKEFTTYPKRAKLDLDDKLTESFQKKQTEIFIKLKEDFTFEQCTALHFSDGIDDDGTLEDQLAMEVSKRERESFAWKGTWDFVDGELILAADRSEKKPFFEEVEDSPDNEADTILVGRVAVQSEESLTDNPAVEQQKETLSDEDAATNNNDNQQVSKKEKIDVHLSVPRGKIKTGKFMYPKEHPAFFEQPIFRPQPKGSFELRQILGEYNAKLGDEDELVELFRKKDLEGKRFYLTTFPLPKRRKKFEYWSKEDNCYKTGEYEPTAAEKAEEELEPGKNMQVVAVELFQNNTFSTLYGLGNSTVLRGKWSIIGDKRDQLWMMVHRFGWGRSVSGSTFSEGKSLTQDDEKSYWGKIKEVPKSADDSDKQGGADTGDSKKVSIKGAVMVGWGLEPCSVGRFKMTEIEDILEDEEDDEEEEEEYEALSDEDVIESALNFDSLLGMDVSKNDDEDDYESFEMPGAFE